MWTHIYLVKKRMAISPGRYDYLNRNEQQGQGGGGRYVDLGGASTAESQPAPPATTTPSNENGARFTKWLRV